MSGKSHETITIQANQRLSEQFFLKRDTIVGIRIPEEFTGTNITILESPDPQRIPFSEISPLGLGGSYPAVRGRTIGIPANNAACAIYAQIRSDAVEAANRELIIITRTVA